MFCQIRINRAAIAFMTTVIGLVGSASCGLTGPGDPERSIVGTYRGEWRFGVYDPNTIARGDDPPGVESRGWVHCPAEFQVMAQDGKDISGRFELRTRSPMSCTFRQEGFCTEAMAAQFCRQLSGTFRGEAFSNGAPNPSTILFKFRMSVAQADGRAALEQFVGCPVIAQESDVFTGGVWEDRTADASMQMTADCGGRAGLGRVDLAVLLAADRVASGQ